MEKRNLVIDSMKGIACIGVVITHTDMINMNGILGVIARFGVRGVQIFFIISAFLIFKSLESSGCGTKDFNIKRWYYNKFLRLIPLYWGAIISYLIIFGITYWTSSANKGIICMTVMSDILFLSGIDPFHLNVFWYIGALGVFIIISPFLFNVIKNWGGAVLLFVFTYAIFTIGVPILADRINFGYNHEVWYTYWRSHSVFANLSILSLGIILYFLIYCEKLNLLIKSSVRKCGIDIKHISRAVLLCLLLLVGEHVYASSGIVVYGLLFCIIIFNEMVSENKVLTNSVFAFFGKYSYGIYLAHLPIMYILKQTFVCGGGVLLTIVTIIASLGISILATNAIEKPIISVLRK